MRNLQQRRERRIVALGDEFDALAVVAVPDVACDPARGRLVADELAESDALYAPADYCLQPFQRPTSWLTLYPRPHTVILIGMANTFSCAPSRALMP